MMRNIQIVKVDAQVEEAQRFSLLVVVVVVAVVVGGMTMMMVVG